MGNIERMENKISFIGVGPGDPELLTLKALKKIKIADVIIWTDSLIPENILDFTKEGSEKIKTSSLNLEQITSIMIKKFQEGKTVIRLHDGDPCLFGAIREQIAGKIKRMDNKISFIGVGPGDPELLTLKALKKIKIADVIIWTDSLIPEKILDFAKEGSEKIKTSSLNLEQITSIMIEKFQAGKTVVRLHDGDPCLFGAIREQIEILKNEKIEIEVVPGVSAFQVAAAYHEAELTIPDVTQTIILTRAGGRTGMPEKESLKDLAKHNSSICLYLSARHVKRSQETLLEFYPPETKVIVGFRVSWDDGWTSLIELKDMEKFSIEKKLIRTTIYIISPAISNSQKKRSNLYNQSYKHLFRNK